jgi:glucosamine--fructose-6-phosphate aminotransferase (isomerizing)
MTHEITVVEQEIRSTPAILRQAIARVAEQGDAMRALLQGPLVFLGCGSSYCIAVAAAALYETATGEPAHACIASEYLPRPSWTHVAISRTGQTTELVEAMRRARAAGARVALICGALQAPAAEHADLVLPLEFAAEESVIQTRFIAAAILTLRLLIGGPAALAALPDQMERALTLFDPEALTGFTRIVFLGRGWRYGLAMIGALNLQETALCSPNGHQTLEYRHGPLAGADAQTLVWCYDPPADPLSAGVLRDVLASDATVRCTDDDPLISAAQAQIVAVRVARLRGIDPDAPRHLSRAIVAPHEMPLIGALS